MVYIPSPTIPNRIKLYNVVFINKTKICNIKSLYKTLWLFSSPEHEVLMVRYCGQSMSHPSCVVHRAALTIALKAYSSYTPGPIDSILGRKHQGDL